MKVICPKCQFENQADSSRIVCARCATIIEVRAEQGGNFDANGKRQTARLPFTGNAAAPPLSNPPINPVNQSRDTYATRVGDDFDDVLDIPRPAQGGFPSQAETTPAFDDVFAMPNYEASAGFDFSRGEKAPTTPIENFNTAPSRQRETQDYVGSAEPEFMGWPVLPESIEDEVEPASGMNGNRGGLLLRVGLIVLVFGVLSFLVYYFLWDQITKRKEQAREVASGAVPTQTTQGNTPGQLPNVDLSKIEPPKPAMTELPKPANTNANTVTPPTKQPDTSVPSQTGRQVDIPPQTGPTGPKGPSDSPKPAPQTTAPATKTPTNGSLTIQAGSFSDQGQANDRAARLKSAGVDARVVKAELAGKGTWYRVQIGGFKTREDAVSYGNQLRAKGTVQDFIVTTIGK